MANKDSCKVAAYQRPMLAMTLSKSLNRFCVLLLCAAQVTMLKPSGLQATKQLLFQQCIIERKDSMRLGMLQKQQMCSSIS